MVPFIHKYYKDIRCGASKRFILFSLTPLSVLARKSELMFPF